jgi:hypothetical protein
MCLMVDAGEDARAPGELLGAGFSLRPWRFAPPIFLFSGI